MKIMKEIRLNTGVQFLYKDLSEVLSPYFLY